MSFVGPRENRFRVISIVAVMLALFLTADPARAGVTTRVRVTRSGKQADGTSCAEGISADGRRVVFTGLAKNLYGGGGDAFGYQVFVRDRDANTTLLVSKNSAGGVANDTST